MFNLRNVRIVIITLFILAVLILGAPFIRDLIDQFFSLARHWCVETNCAR